jgi:hypothetical protein
MCKLQLVRFDANQLNRHCFYLLLQSSILVVELEEGIVNYNLAKTSYDVVQDVPWLLKNTFEKLLLLGDVCFVNQPIESLQSLLVLNSNGEGGVICRVNEEGDLEVLELPLKAIDWLLSLLIVKHEIIISQISKIVKL